MLLYYTTNWIYIQHKLSEAFQYCIQAPDQKRRDMEHGSGVDSKHYNNMHGPRDDAETLRDNGATHLDVIGIRFSLSLCKVAKL